MEEFRQDEQDGGRIHSALSRVVIGCAMKVHRVLGPGFLESVYQNALLIELRKSRISAQPCKRIEVRYEGAIVGDFVADLVIEGKILIENKAVYSLVSAHEAQLVNYLTATGLDVGLLLNFGAPSLEYKRKLRIPLPKKNSSFTDDVSF